jgi:hypothetical protein
VELQCGKRLSYSVCHGLSSVSLKIHHRNGLGNLQLRMASSCARSCCTFTISFPFHIIVARSAAITDSPNRLLILPPNGWNPVDILKSIRDRGVLRVWYWRMRRGLGQGAVKYRRLEQRRCLDNVSIEPARPLQRVLCIPCCSMALSEQGSKSLSVAVACALW